MTFRLECRTNPARTLQLNGWTWRAVLAAMSRLGLITNAEAAQMGAQLGFGISAERSREMAGHLRRLMPDSETARRMDLCGRWTDRADDGMLHLAPGELDRNFSIDRETLTALIAFLDGCDGFTVC